MQVSEADLRVKYTAEVGTDRGPVRTAIENPADEILPTRRYSLEGLLVRLVLARPGEDERGTVLEHGGKIPAVDTQTMGWTLAVRVETQERCTTISLGDAFAQIPDEIDPVWFDGEAKVGVTFDDRQGLPTHEDGVGSRIEKGCTSENEPTLSDIHTYASLDAPVGERVEERTQGVDVLSQEDAVVGVKEALWNAGGRVVQTNDQLIDIDVEEVRRERRSLQDASRTWEPVRCLTVDEGAGA